MEIPYITASVSLLDLDLFILYLLDLIMLVGKTNLEVHPFLLGSSVLENKTFSKNHLFG